MSEIRWLKVVKFYSPTRVAGYYHLKKVHAIATVYLGTQKSYSFRSHFYDNFRENKSRSTGAQHRLLIGYGYICTLKNPLSAVI